MSPQDDRDAHAKKGADESWKEQARREKERLAEELATEAQKQEVPAASLIGLVEELSVRALLCLGQLVDPRSGQSFVDLPAARYVIDVLEVLQTKTKGNLDAEEEGYLSDVVHKLRLAYVEVARLVGAQVTEGEGEEGESAGSPILTPDEASGDSAAPQGSGGDGPEEGEDTGGPRIIV